MLMGEDSEYPGKVSREEKTVWERVKYVEIKDWLVWLSYT